MSDVVKTASAASVEVRRCKLCGMKLGGHNPRNFCLRHTTEFIVKFVKDGVTSTVCSQEQVYRLVCEELVVPEQGPKQNLQHASPTDAVTRARWAAVWLFKYDLGLKLPVIASFFGLQADGGLPLTINKIEDALGEDDVLWSAIVNVRKRYSPKPTS